MSVPWSIRVPMSISISRPRGGSVWRSPMSSRPKPQATYCPSGFRASIASSLWAMQGVTDIRNVPGSWKAWSAAGYPSDKESTQ